jgi:hypothetical protein
MTQWLDTLSYLNCGRRGLRKHNIPYFHTHFHIRFTVATNRMMERHCIPVNWLFYVVWYRNCFSVTQFAAEALACHMYLQRVTDRRQDKAVSYYHVGINSTAVVA